MISTLVNVSGCRLLIVVILLSFRNRFVEEIDCYPAGNNIFKVNNRNTKTKCEICSKLTIKIPERRIFIVNFEHISYLVLVFLLLTLSRLMPAG